MSQIVQLQLRNVLITSVKNVEILQIVELMNYVLSITNAQKLALMILVVKLYLIFNTVIPSKI